ncbi:hypothetical protein Pla175_18290 [Pirellulimonas nuda]|uniref:Transcription factor zinc-finger domain-containing protein n=1 Tax=Pirellulimonas nuda TaxID=2528009 RepID=A0A518DAE3_9BACT|nr:zf-TFIIB domain-containing protein [Pirellulimonas nuda]QDU88451.1 hypothetical protein Pla175_18290 [Pirellulimonas nuda]
MLCPRCQLTLQETDYEGQHVYFCTNCWGYWMEKSQLDAIVADKSTRFSGAEKRVVRQAVGAGNPAHAAESTPAPCPVCQKAMQKTTYTQACPVELDLCRAHGVWLDAGELKELQVLWES